MTSSIFICLICRKQVKDVVRPPKRKLKKKLLINHKHNRRRTLLDGMWPLFHTHQPCKRARLTCNTKRRQTSTSSGAITVSEIIRIQSSPGMIMHMIVELKIMKEENLGSAYIGCSDEKALLHPRTRRGRKPVLRMKEPCFTF